MVLKLWTYDTFDGDYFVAESAEEADAMLKEHSGWNLEELIANEGIEGEWTAMPDDKVFKLRLEEETCGLPAGVHEKTAAEWCAANGKGYLFSMNY